jgi:hypothetical protein
MIGLCQEGKSSPDALRRSAGVKLFGLQRRGSGAQELSHLFRGGLPRRRRCRAADLGPFPSCPDNELRPRLSEVPMKMHPRFSPAFPMREPHAAKRRGVLPAVDDQDRDRSFVESPVPAGSLHRVRTIRNTGIRRYPKLKKANSPFEFLISPPKMDEMGSKRNFILGNAKCDFVRLFHGASPRPQFSIAWPNRRKCV